MSIHTYLNSHSGPCYEAKWAHPKFENVIATCGFDKKINIWKEVRLGQWDRVFSFEAKVAVNTVAWAPWEYGLVLAAGVSDGKVLIISRKPDDTWYQTEFIADNSGVLAVSWGPASQPTMLSVSG